MSQYQAEDADDMADEYEMKDEDDDMDDELRGKDNCGSDFDANEYDAMAKRDKECKITKKGGLYYEFRRNSRLKISEINYSSFLEKEDHVLNRAGLLLERKSMC
ncbi:hypothetical protein POM88_012605 [Heracleum sosnowskyi]|uniref:Uncharacterized protein n=1 Tax=Heracleum sosnowskyi TaxID=360622 RepID=A0AAD8IWT5_9APIA|nr:hypothetical protein POM88_012605 [Heracleum sosnowskyi]